MQTLENCIILFIFIARKRVMRNRELRKKGEREIPENERRIASSLDDRIPHMEMPFIASNCPPLNGDQLMTFIS